MTDPLRQSGNFSQDFRRKIAGANLFETPCQHGPPIQQPALPHERGRNPDTQRKKCVLPVRALEGANIPARLVALDGYEPQLILDLPERRVDQQLRSAFVAEFLPERQFPRSHRRVFSARDAGKSNFRDRAGANETKPGASEQVTQIRAFNISASAEAEFFAEQITEVNRRTPVKNHPLRGGKRFECGWRCRMRQRAEQRFGIRAKKIFGLRPNTMPSREDQEFIVIGSVLNLLNARKFGGNLENSFKVRQLTSLRSPLLLAQLPEFRLRQRKLFGDGSCFLQHRIAEFRQTNASARFVGVSRNCRRNRPGMFPLGRRWS